MNMPMEVYCLWQKEKKTAVKDTDAALDDAISQIEKNLVKGLLCVLETVQQWM